MAKEGAIPTGKQKPWPVSPETKKMVREKYSYLVRTKGEAMPRPKPSNQLKDWKESLRQIKNSL